MWDLPQASYLMKALLWSLHRLMERRAEINRIIEQQRRLLQTIIRFEIEREREREDGQKRVACLDRQLLKASQVAGIMGTHERRDTASRVKPRRKTGC